MKVLRMSWDDMPVEFAHPSIGDVRSVHAGDLTIERARAKAGVNLGRALEGKKNDGLCDSPHWGYVISGAFVVHEDGNSWRIEAGQIYYIEPHHTVEIVEDVETIDISPTVKRTARMRSIKEDMRKILQGIKPDQLWR